MRIETTEADRQEMAAMEAELARGQAEVDRIMALERERLRRKEEEKRAAAPRYRCECCSAVHAEHEMGSDHYPPDGAGDEVWSSWICPTCGAWHSGLTTEDGWTPEPRP